MRVVDDILRDFEIYFSNYHGVVRRYPKDSKQKLGVYTANVLTDTAKNIDDAKGKELTELVHHMFHNYDAEQKMRLYRVLIRLIDEGERQEAERYSRRVDILFQRES